MAKRLMLVIGLVLLIAVGATIVALPVLAHGPCEGDGRAYGQDHISSHTPHGPADEHHNPGTHHGFSACDPDGGHGANDS